MPNAIRVRPEPNDNPSTPSNRHMKKRTSPLFILVAVVTAITALYVAKEILLPIALAILLTFLLTPFCDWLERWRVPRIVAVLLVVVSLFLAFAGGVGAVTQQLFQPSSELPKHTAQLQEKFKPLHKVKQSISKLRDTLAQSASEQGANETGNEGSKAEKGSKAEEKSPAKENEGKSDSPTELTKSDKKDPDKSGAATASQPSPTSPTPVEIIDSTSPLFSAAREWVGGLLAPIGTAGIVIVLVLFLLLDRESQRSRLLQLFGRSHMHQTAEAVHDVSYRVGVYLRTLF